VDDLWVAKSERVGLIDRAIGFQDFQVPTFVVTGPDPPTSQTDGQTDDMQSRGNKNVSYVTIAKKADCTAYERRTV